MMLYNSSVFLMGLTKFYVVFAEPDEVKTEKVQHSFAKMLKNIVKANERRMDALKKITELQDYVITKTRTGYTDDENDDEMEGSSESGSSQNAVIAVPDITQNNGPLRRAHKSKYQKELAKSIIFVPVEINHKKDKLDIIMAIAGRPIFKVNDESKEIKDLPSTQNSRKRRQFNVEVTEDERKVYISAKDNNVKIQVIGLRRHWTDSCTKKAKKLCISACINATKNFCKVFICSRLAKSEFKKRCKRSCNTELDSSKYVNFSDADK